MDKEACTRPRKRARLIMAENVYETHLGSVESDIQYPSSCRIVLWWVHSSNRVSHGTSLSVVVYCLRPQMSICRFSRSHSIEKSQNDQPRGIEKRRLYSVSTVLCIWDLFLYTLSKAWFSPYLETFLFGNLRAISLYLDFGIQLLLFPGCCYVEKRRSSMWTPLNQNILW